MQVFHYIYIVWSSYVGGCSLSKFANHMRYALVGFGASVVFGMVTGATGEGNRNDCCGGADEITNKNFHGDNPLIYAMWLKGASLYGDGECPANFSSKANVCSPA